MLRGLIPGSLLLIAFAIAPAPARAQSVDLELILAVDVSSSVTGKEFRLQMDGISNAFRDAQVHKALQAHIGRGVAVTLVQWSGSESHSQVLDWSIVRDEASALAFARKLDATGRLVAGGATAIGEAINYAAALLEFNQWQGDRRVIDVSGDGASNQGESPSFSRARANRLGITINGLAILNEEPRLDRYYEAGVVGGPGAFLITADDFEAFADSMRRKLVREISGTPVSSLPAIQVTSRR